MLFFLGLLVGSTAGFFCAAMAHAASADASVREQVADMPPLPTYLQQAPMNTGRYAIVNESANGSSSSLRSGTDG